MSYQKKNLNQSSISNTLKLKKTTEQTFTQQGILLLNVSSEGMIWVEIIKISKLKISKLL